MSYFDDEAPAYEWEPEPDVDHGKWWHWVGLLLLLVAGYVAMKAMHGL